MIPQITTFSQPAAIVRYTIQVLYLTESEAFLNHATTGNVLYQTIQRFRVEVTHLGLSRMRKNLKARGKKKSSFVELGHPRLQVAALVLKRNRLMEYC